MHSLMNIAAIPSVQRLTAVKLLAYNIKGNPCSRDMIYREIRFDILNVKCNDIGGIAARGSFFVCSRISAILWDIILKIFKVMQICIVRCGKV